MMREVCFLIGKTGQILWRDEGSTHALPDSRPRWEAIWHHRSRLAEIAHTHPLGMLAFSSEDRTTMQAISAALGRNITFSVVTSDAMIRTSRGAGDEPVEREPEWVREIRAESGLIPVEFEGMESD